MYNVHHKLFKNKKQIINEDLLQGVYKYLCWKYKWVNEMIKGIDWTKGRDINLY